MQRLVATRFMTCARTSGEGEKSRGVLSECVVCGMRCARASVMQTAMVALPYWFGEPEVRACFSVSMSRTKRSRAARPSRLTRFVSVSGANTRDAL